MAWTFGYWSGSRFYHSPAFTDVNISLEDAKILQQQLKESTGKCICLLSAERFQYFYQQESVVCVDSLGERKFQVFDTLGVGVSDPYYSLKEALDFEEDFCYTVLEQQLEQGVELFSPILEIWELSPAGEKLERYTLA